MAVSDVVADYVRRDDGSERAVHLLPAAAAVRLGPVTVVSEGSGDREGARVLVDAWFSGWDAGAAAVLAEELGPHDVGVVLLRTPAADLPVGPIIAAVSEAGLRVVRAQAVTGGAARTVVVLTHDVTVPLRTHLLGTPIPDDDASRARLAAEWLVEGLQLRAGLTRAEEQVRELQAQCAQLSERALAAESSLERVRTEGGLAGLRRDSVRSVELVRTSGLAGLGRVLRGLRRRLGGPRH
jgi:hypothetical protein